MKIEKDIISSRNDKSQVLSYSNPFFPCIWARSFYTPDMTTHIPEHWHEDIEYLYVLEGHIDYNIHGEVIRLEENQGIMVNSGRIHSNISPKDEYCVFIYGLVNPLCLRTSSYMEQKYILPVTAQGSFDYFLLSKDDWTKEIIEDIERLRPADGYQGTCFELDVMESSFRHLRLIHENINLESSFSNTSSAYTNTFRDMVTYIGNHYMEKVSLDDIAAAGCVGKTLCAKIFKKLTGKTPGDYLIHYRINKSMELLESHALSITEIAYQTGFNSASHYSKTFHDYVGCTPNKYRNQE